MKIGELFVQLGVKADTFTVRDFARAIGDLPLAAAGAITSLTGLSVGFLELTKHTLDISNSLGVFRSETGLSVEELQRWQAVAKQVGISSDTIQSSIMGITNALAQLRLGNPSALLPLGRLGVDVRGKTPFQILQDIGRNAQRLDPSVARTLMGQLGVNPEMMRIFSLGPGQFNRMAAGGVVMNESQLKVMQDFQEAIGRFEITIERAFVPALEKVEPFLADLAEVLGDIIQFFGSSLQGYGALSKFYTSIKKEGGVGNFLDNLVNSGLTPAMLRDPRMVHAYFNTTQNIHSTADPQEVARIAKDHLDREKTNANKYFNNGGY